MAAAAVGLPLYYGANKLISQAAERELNGMQRKFDKAVEAEIAKAESLAALVAMEPDVRQAMAAGDRDALSKAFVGGFDTMRSVYGFEQLQFHTPDAHAFFRVHSPTKFGDDLSSFRRTVVEANRTHKPVVGLERGQAGVGVRAIYPIFIRRQTCWIDGIRSWVWEAVPRPADRRKQRRRRTVHLPDGCKPGHRRDEAADGRHV